jgi:hypothetical protein
MVSLIRNFSNKFKNTEDYFEQHLRIFDIIIHFLEETSNHVEHAIDTNKLHVYKDAYTYNYNYNYNYIPPLAILNLDIDNSVSIKCHPIQFLKNNPVIASLIREDLYNEFSGQGGTLKWILLVFRTSLAIFFNDLLIKCHHVVDKDLILEMEKEFKELESIDLFGDSNIYEHRIQAIQSFSKLHKFVTDIAEKIEKGLNSDSKQH